MCVGEASPAPECGLWPFPLGLGVRVADPGLLRAVADDARAVDSDVEGLDESSAAACSPDGTFTGVACAVVEARISSTVADDVTAKSIFASVTGSSCGDADITESLSSCAYA